MMFQDVDSALDAWEGFYLIVGGAGAALTGLQFVVMSVLDGARTRGDSRISADASSLGAFGTPTVVHFCAALLMSGIITVPWDTVGGLRTALVVIGAAGLAYAAIITYRARRQTSYKPVLEDWLFHVLFPLAAYGGIMVAGTLLRRDLEDALFIVGAMSMFLLFIGIHNAWDTVTYLMVGDGQAPHGPAEAPSRPPRPAVQGRRGRRHR